MYLEKLKTWNGIKTVTLEIFKGRNDFLSNFKYVFDFIKNLDLSKYSKDYDNFYPNKKTILYLESALLRNYFISFISEKIDFGFDSEKFIDYIEKINPNYKTRFLILIHLTLKKILKEGEKQNVLISTKSEEILNSQTKFIDKEKYSNISESFKNGYINISKIKEEEKENDIKFATFILDFLLAEGNMEETLSHILRSKEYKSYLIENEIEEDIEINDCLIKLFETNLIKDILFNTIYSDLTLELKKINIKYYTKILYLSLIIISKRLEELEEVYEVKNEYGCYDFISKEKYNSIFERIDVND